MVRILYRATGGLNLNLSEIQQLGEIWNSSTMVDVYEGLIQNTSDANAGSLYGNRNFYNNDYMVCLTLIPFGPPDSYFIMIIGSARRRLCYYAQDVVGPYFDH